MRPAAAAFLFLLLAVSAGLTLTPAAAQDPEWHLVGRARLGDPDTAAPYQVELHSTHDTPDRFPRNTDATFRFGIVSRANATLVAPGPDLQLFVYRCAETATPDTDCSDAVRESTEIGYVLRDDADGLPDGRYLWQPLEREVLASEGLWRASVWIANQTVNNTATFLIPVGVDAPKDSWITQALRYVFGVEGSFLTRLFVFVGWVIVFVLLTRYSTRIARRTILSPRRVDPTVGRLAARLIGTFVFVVGLAFSLWVTFRVNFWAGLTALGLLSVALGFGMQNTVANIMGGISLALDKPFVIGDRIEVGETWGDVEEVGLRSTRILTTKKEYVIIPNKLMDEREIWNYTRSHQELRVDIDVGISYDSDRRLAEALLIEAARDCKDILPYPRPRVLLMKFNDFSVDLQLRCWLRHAKDARIIASDLRKAIKDLFDENGVEIPFPYRTLVQKTDLAPPKKATPEELARYRTPEEGLPRMLYATAGPEPLDTAADLVAHIASNLDMALVVAHVVRPGYARARMASVSYRIFSAFEDASTHHNVPLRTLQREGEVTPTIQALIEEEKIDLLVLGSSRHHPLFLSPRLVADLARHIRDNVKVPVLIIPRSLRVQDRTLEHYRKAVEERVAARDKPARIQAEGTAPENGDESASDRDEGDERDEGEEEGERPPLA